MLVLGAGYAGLVTARRLAAAGASVMVLEALDEAGTAVTADNSQTKLASDKDGKLLRLDDEDKTEADLASQTSKLDRCSVPDNRKVAFLLSRAHGGGAPPHQVPHLSPHCMEDTSSLYECQRTDISLEKAPVRKGMS